MGAPMTRSCKVLPACLVVITCFASACSRPILAGGSLRQPAPQAAVLELWEDPGNIAQRDLLWGSARPDGAPSASDVYTVLALDKTGYSKGYDVKGPDGREWDIKLGREVQPEIVLSRILWALGYHQPQTYYVTGWQLEGSWDSEGEPARFRARSDHESEGEWKWLENPFAGTRPLQGLVAINLLLNNYDLKTSNNRVYRLREPKAEPARRYVVQDLGNALGKPRGLPYLSGTRDDIDDYESFNLIRKVTGSAVQLNYRGVHGDILERLSTGDVIWACELMSRLNDAQLDDAFKAAEYPPDIRQRYIRKLRAKIQEGLALREDRQARRREP
jgi:hypothetical protein